MGCPPEPIATVEDPPLPITTNVIPPEPFAPGASGFAIPPPVPVVPLGNPRLSVVHPDSAKVIDSAMATNTRLSSHDIRNLRVCMEKPPEANRCTSRRIQAAIPALQHHNL